MADQDNIPHDKKPNLNLPTATSYAVGYAKPPAETRFKPGQSGNPHGRPKGSRRKSPQYAGETSLSQLIRTEANRTIPTIEKGKRIEISVAQAIVRTLSVKAIKGNNRSADILLKLKASADAEYLASKEDFFQTAIEYKQAWKVDVERRKKAKLPLANPLPYPDDVIVDTDSMDVKFIGPMTKEQVEQFNLGASVLRRIERSIPATKEKLTNLAEGLDRQELIDLLADKTDAVDVLRKLYGPRRYRVSNNYFETKDLRELQECLAELDRQYGNLGR